MLRVDANGAVFVRQGLIGTEQVFDRRLGPRLHSPSFAQTQPFPAGIIGCGSRFAKTLAKSSDVTVWAARVGNWVKGPSWEYLVPFSSLSNLDSQLENKGLRGRVTQLGIVAHGDQPGLVALDRDLTVKTLPEFYLEISTLAQYLAPDAWVTFYSCVAGMGKEGSDFLINISKHLRGRTIVGFELYGFIGGMNEAGKMKASETPYAGVAVDPKKDATHGYLNPWCRFAKRAKDGRIVHLPELEQNNRRNFTCANPSCPGHGAPSHSCVKW